MDEQAKDACPAPEMLAAFASGNLADDDLNRVAAHLEQCPACVKSLNTGDPFTQHLQQIHQDGVSPWAESETLLSVKLESTPYFFDVTNEAPTKDADRFFDALAQSRLFDINEMKQVRQEWKAFRSTDLATFTQTLVLEGRLTEFHVRQLLRGKALAWILNDYVVLHPIGSASKAWVYLAYHTKKKRTYVLKIAPPQLAPSATVVKRFRQEIDIIARLRHPRLSAAIDIGEALGVSYVAMEELPGHSLAEWVELHGPMRMMSAVDMIREACEGIAAAHEAELVHSDVKPSNLWVETYAGTGRASQSGPGLKVLDFGAAKLNSAEARKLTESGHAAPIATIGYTAPEVALWGAPAEVRSDIFGLGCCLYFLLSGKAPYEGSYPLVDGKPREMPALESPKDPLPAPLQMIYRRMVAISPQGRYGSVDELIEDLDAFLAGAKVRSPRVRSAVRLATAGAAAIAIVAAIWFGFSFWTGGPQTVSEADRVLKIHGPAPKPLDGPREPEDVAAIQNAWAAALEIPVEITNTIGMKLRLVPPGTIGLGTPAGETDSRLAQLVPGTWQSQWLRKNGDLELPRHDVILTQPFYVGATEVTVAQFRAFLEDTKRRTVAETDGLGGVSYSVNQFRRRSPTIDWKSPGYDTSDTMPVTQITYDEAAAFCKWLSERERRAYTLPTESQWEFACRAGRQERWFWGSDPDGARDYASLPRDDQFGPSPVALAKPNSLGLFDMAGNVAEWCADLFDPDFTPPAKMQDPAVRTQGTVHIARGGAFLHPIPDGIASASRIDPLDACQDFVGFRVIIPLKVVR